MTVIKKFIIYAVLILLATLYMTFLYLDYNRMNTFYTTYNLKYISILLCFLLSLMAMDHAISPIDIRLLQTGLFMTTLADLCLLVLDKFTIGVAVFCVTQIIYCIRYNSLKAYPTVVRFLMIFEVLAILYILLGFFIKNLETLFWVATAYAICLMTSVIRAIKLCQAKQFPSPNRYMIAIGMVLFLLCDINVGLSNVIQLLRPQSIFLTYIYNISTFLIWFFYLPSQVLLAMSGYNFCQLRIRN
ncbi:lysoplasmalogenase family protein [Clostridium thermarum]|uniref:lysoplasmalogenase family protein n=1 Tax=Clostridium thermarum TaxID=1716543 RepID=UPI0013D5A007|nr:lysoplasmalogenase family protein [Clostridium thermarum]